MSCLSGARIAAAASGEDAAALRHATTCAACAAALARDRTTRIVLTGAPEVPLAAARRAAMRAEVLAASDAMAVAPSVHPRRTIGIMAMAVAAVVLALLFARSGAPARGPDAAVPVPGSAVAAVGSERVGSSPVAVAVPTPVAVAAPPPLAGGEPPPVAAASSSADIQSKGAWFERKGDVVQVADGAVTVDSRGHRAAELVVGDARIAVADAQVRVTVRHGQLVQLQVFAGAAEITVAGRAQVISVGDVWQVPAARPLPPPPKPSAAATSSGRSAAEAPPAPEAPAAVRSPTPVGSPALDAFRIGWEALRAGRHRDAIAAFDRATDPAVAEDARYWAAVAAARAGDPQDAQRRLREFVIAFPASLHVAAARAALRP